MLLNTPARKSVEVHDVQLASGECFDAKGNTRSADSSTPAAQSESAASAALSPPVRQLLTPATWTKKLARPPTQPSGSAESGADSAARAGEAAGSTAEDAARKLEKGAEKAGEAVADAARGTGGAVEREAEQAGINERDDDAIAKPDSNTMAQARQPEITESGDQTWNCRKPHHRYPLLHYSGWVHYWWNRCTLSQIELSHKQEGLSGMPRRDFMNSGAAFLTFSLSGITVSCNGVASLRSLPSLLLNPLQHHPSKIH